VAGLEAIIDATAGILAAQSLEATLQAMADALAPIVPYASLVVYEVASILVAPLRVGGRVQGTLNVWREASDVEFAEDVLFTPAEMMLIERFASLAAIAYANSSQREQLRSQALTDELTGLYNRRHCKAVLRDVLEDGRRHHEPTSIAYFDIDAFKSINDAFGHGAGDEALLRATRAGRDRVVAADAVSG
jgi:predicted signal transduction protein with EAL and GGDEF domain